MAQQNNPSSHDMQTLAQSLISAQGGVKQLAVSLAQAILAAAGQGGAAGVVGANPAGGAASGMTVGAGGSPSFSMQELTTTLARAYLAGEDGGGGGSSSCTGKAGAAASVRQSMGAGTNLQSVLRDAHVKLQQAMQQANSPAAAAGGAAPSFSMTDLATTLAKALLASEDGGGGGGSSCSCGSSRASASLGAGGSGALQAALLDAHLKVQMAMQQLQPASGGGQTPPTPGP